MKDVSGVTPAIEQLLKDRSRHELTIDLGCGDSKQHPDYIGIDYRPLPGVDIVHDLELFPYPLPDECATQVVCSHVLEHIDPHGGDARVAPLIQLLLKKKLITPAEVSGAIGEIDPGPRFLRLMDEVWRILKPGGRFCIAVPFAASAGFWQDPTHINGISEATWAYFDPLETRSNGLLYKIYRPKPWRIEPETHSWFPNGNQELILTKRKIDKSYYE